MSIREAPLRQDGVRARQRPLLRRRQRTDLGGRVGPGPAVLTSEYKIDHFRPPSGETIVARASVVHAGKRQAVCRCDALFVGEDHEEVLCAVAQGMIYATAVDGPEHPSMTTVKVAEGADGT